MEYAQLNEAGTDALQITTHENVLWDENHFCPAKALTEDEAAMFRVVPLTVVAQPTYDAITQRCFRDGCAQIGGQWQYKWTVEALDADTIAANQTAADALARATAKAVRAQAVEAIKVTTQAGNTFDGDETSQGRMARAIIALSTGLAPSVTWVLANNTTINATPAELTEALVLAGQAQASIWVIP